MQRDVINNKNKLLFHFIIFLLSQDYFHLYKIKKRWNLILQLDWRTQLRLLVFNSDLFLVGCPRKWISFALNIMGNKQKTHPRSTASGLPSTHRKRSRQALLLINTLILNLRYSKFGWQDYQHMSQCFLGPAPPQNHSKESQQQCVRGEL